ncbi:hypothetical protein [Amnibacterium endophyticum]|uniref:RDD family protein n=1 Tax=Amnibacterium endophyticum TaxID=2109337 RepID=A0ABW4LAE9_9MICO
MPLSVTGRSGGNGAPTSSSNTGAVLLGRLKLFVLMADGLLSISALISIGLGQ